MSILLMDPTGSVAKTPHQEEHRLDNLNGKKVGFIFNQHSSGLAFWKALENEVERKLQPSSAHRVYKENTWAPAPATEVERLERETDYVLVGLGA